MPREPPAKPPIKKTTTNSSPEKRKYKIRSKTKSKIKSSIMVLKEDDLEDDTVVEPRDTKPKDDDVEGDSIVEPTDKGCYTAISPKLAPDLKIEPFEVSMVYGVSIDGPIVIPRDMDTILTMANSFKHAKQEQFKMKMKQEREFTDNTTKMMYVSGETAEPSAETTGMVEEIVRQQVIEMVRLLRPHQPTASSSFP